MGLLPDRPLTRGVLRISTPAVAGLSSLMIVSVVETAMVGRLENTTVVLAAMGLGSLATWAITSVFSTLATGTHVLVARRAGEHDLGGAGAALNNSLLLSLSLGLLFGLPGYLFAHPIIAFFSSDPAVARAGTGYMQWRFLGLAVFLFVVSYRGFFNGIGHTKIFMYSAIVTNLSALVFDYLLIFGVLGLPRMGLTGVGIASTISNVLGLLFLFGTTFRPRYRREYGYYRHFGVKWDVMQQIVRISVPVSLQNLLILLGFLVFVAITGVIGTAEQAASQVVISALFMSFLPCFGFGTGAQTLVGQCLGRGELGLAKRYGYEAARHATYFTLLLGIVFVVFPEMVIGAITTDQGLVQVARPILQIVGVAQIFYAAGIVLAHALQAAGATVFVMWVEVLTHWVIFLPIAYLLGVVWGGGIVGAWLAMPVYIISYTTLIVRKYRRGSWLHLKV
jgi:multidrug resistance protein, MATE family